MTKGGARARSGPPPDPNALRRDRDQGEWTILPAVGREGDPPPWPLLDQTEREVELWSALWAKPQALMWERFGQELEVGLYVRRLTIAEQLDAPVTLGALVRQQADSLGLTTPGMRANRWRIDRLVEQDQPQQPKPEGRNTRARPSARDRMKVIRGGAAS